MTRQRSETSAVRGVLLLLGLAACAACGGGEARRPNVLLVTVDTLRPDHLSCYGSTRVATPNVDRLAREGALFENAVTDSPWTTPAMASVMTGTYPTRHGFKSTNVDRLPLSRVTLAELLRDAGYTTAAVIGSFPLDAIFQIDQGFEHYDDDFTTPIVSEPGHHFTHVPSVFRDTPEAQATVIFQKAMNDSRREDSEVADAAIQWLAQTPARPFFLWVHFFGPHAKPDWSVPEAERDRERLRSYDPDVVVADAQVGRLLAALDDEGLARDTLVIFHADHGESLGERGFIGHGQLLNEATMRVPLILRYPGRVAASLRVSALVRNVDIFASVLDAAGVEAAGKVNGESLLPLVRPGWRHWLAALADEGPAERVAYMETYYPAHSAFATPVTLPDGRRVKVGVIRRGVRTTDWKFVRQEPHALFDVSEAKQPEITDFVRAKLTRESLVRVGDGDGEGRDALADHPQVAQHMRELLDRELAVERTAARIPGRPVDDETRLRLKALGYGD